MFNRLRAYEARIRSEFSRGNHEYFRAHDDFLTLPRSRISSHAIMSKGMRTMIYSGSALFCGIGLLIAIAVNEDQAKKRWVYHPTPPSYVPTKPQPTTRPSIPEQPLPPSGTIRTFTTAEQVAPFEIKGAQASHYLLKLVDAYTGAPVMTVFVRSGSTVNVDVALGTYELRYASGETWYGYEYLFGPETA